MAASFTGVIIILRPFPKGIVQETSWLLPITSSAISLISNSLTIQIVIGGVKPSFTLKH